MPPQERFRHAQAGRASSAILGVEVRVSLWTAAKARKFNFGQSVKVIRFFRNKSIKTPIGKRVKRFPRKSEARKSMNNAKAGREKAAFRVFVVFRTPFPAAPGANQAALMSLERSDARMGRKVRRGANISELSELSERKPKDGRHVSLFSPFSLRFALQTTAQ